MMLVSGSVNNMVNIIYNNGVYTIMASTPQKILFRRITQGPRINLPKEFLDMLGWKVNDQVSIEILPVEGTIKIVITNESQKYRRPLNERLKQGE